MTWTEPHFCAYCDQPNSLCECEPGPVMSKEAAAYRRGQEAMRERVLKTLKVAHETGRIGGVVPDTSGCDCHVQATAVVTLLEPESE